MVGMGPSTTCVWPRHSAKPVSVIAVPSVTAVAAVTATAAGLVGVAVLRPLRAEDRISEDLNEVRDDARD